MKVVQAKAVALILGPAGVGLFGMYQSILNLARSVAGLGINSSGVRQIAEAAGTGDATRVASTVTTLRRFALALSALGGLGLAALSKPVARLTFGNDEHASGIALLSLGLVFTVVADAQGTVLQGMRRIYNLAAMNILAAIFGAVITVPVIYFWGSRGIVISLVAAAMVANATAWWYARKVQVLRVEAGWHQVFAEVSALTKLGIVLLSSGLMATGAAYLIRAIVLRKLGVEAAGFYQAAWSIAGLYVNFILQAMAVDFYPRLTAVEKDRTVCNRLVNEQAEVGILLAGPGILATLTFAPLVISLLYSAKFGPAIELLRWNCLGMLLRVASWPLGYLMLARNTRGLYFCTALAVHVANLVAVWFLTPIVGLKGTGLAVFASSAVDWILMVVVALRINGFQWSVANKKIGLLFGPLVVLVFAGGYFLPRPVVLALGTLATGVTCVYSAKVLCTLVPVNRFPKFIQVMLVRLRLVPAPVVSD